MNKASTTYYHFKKPTVGGSNGIWGFEINETITDIDSTLYDRYNQLIDRRYLNYAINPCFIINQRYGTSATQTTMIDGQKFSDMWIFHKEGTASGQMCYNRQNDLMYSTGYNNRTSYGGRFKCTTAQATASITASTTFYIENTIEGLNYQTLSEQDWITISFYVKSSRQGTYCVSLMNQDKTTSYIYEYSISTSNWERKTFTFKPEINSAYWDKTTTNGLTTKSHLRINFIFAAGSSYHQTSGAWVPGKKLCTSNQVNLFDTTTNTIEFTQLKVEGGEYANLFEQRPYVNEIELCERYLEKCGDLDTVLFGNTNGYIGYREFATNTTAYLHVRFREFKRDIPVIEIQSYQGLPDWFDNDTYGTDAVAVNIGQSGFAIEFNTVETITTLLYGGWCADSSIS